MKTPVERKADPKERNNPDIERGVDDVQNEERPRTQKRDGRGAVSKGRSRKERGRS
jgi:hypothetical protein